MSENCAELMRAGSTPRQTPHSGELALLLLAWVWKIKLYLWPGQCRFRKAGPGVVCMESWSCPFPGHCSRAGRLTNSATTETQILGFELAHLNVYLTYELLEGGDCRSRATESP